MAIKKKLNHESEQLNKANFRSIDQRPDFQTLDIDEKKKGQWSFELSLFPCLPFASKMESAIIFDSNILYPIYKSRLLVACLICLIVIST